MTATESSLDLYDRVSKFAAPVQHAARRNTISVGLHIEA